MEKTPTVEEFLNETVDGNSIYGDLLKNKGDVFYEDDVKKAMIEFAKLHVEAALKAVYEKGLSDITHWSGNPYTGEGSDYLDEDKINSAYPLDNIK